MTVADEMMATLGRACDATTRALELVRNGDDRWRAVHAEAWAEYECAMEAEARLELERESWRQVADQSVDQIFERMIARPLTEREERERDDLWEQLGIQADAIDAVLKVFYAEVSAVLGSNLDPLVAVALLEGRALALGLPAREAERAAQRVAAEWITQ